MLGLRVGILLGFLAGAVVKSLDRPGSVTHSAIERLQAHVQEAVQAGHEAARAKENEMRRDFERTVNRDG
jgi:hypothetical protein